MKILIQKDILLHSMQEVMRAISLKTTLTILTGIKFQVTAQGLTLTGSDTDISIESFIPKEENSKANIIINQVGACVFQAKYFYEIIKKLPNVQISIEIQKQTATIKAEKTEFNLKVWDAEEYPKLPEIDDNCSFFISGELLKNSIRKTVYAVSTSENRPILAGVNWNFDGEQLIAVSTNSHRLAQKNINCQLADIQIQTEPFNIVIPGKSLNELSKILGESENQVKVTLTGQQILFQFKDLLFFSRLLEGNYPDTKKLIPRDMKTKLIVDAGEFHQAIDRASLLSKEDKANIVKLKVDESCKIVLSSNVPEIGKVEEELMCEKFEGEEVQLSFNAKYMMEALRVMDDVSIEIAFNGSMRPFTIKNSSNDDILELILPIRTY